MIIQDEEFGEVIIRKSAWCTNPKFSVSTSGRLAMSVPSHTSEFLAKRWLNASRKQIRESSGTISLNIGLMKVPEPLRDYVILHELAHINHMDHSAAFWAEVCEHDSNYKRHRTQLKKFSPGV